VTGTVRDNGHEINSAALGVDKSVWCKWHSRGPRPSRCWRYSARL